MNCGKPRQRRSPGRYLVYTDASAMRPKDPYLRRAACAFWAGDSKSGSAAWSIPGPVQTVYRAELFAILAALEVFRGEVEIVSDCKGAVGEAERIRACGRVSPTSTHADLWFRYKNALSAEGLGRVLVRWVPSHEKGDSDRICISPEDRNGSNQADRLANALAKRIGPTASQGKLYDRRTRQLAAIQSIQLKILTASQASDPPKAQDRAQRGPSAARGRSHIPPRPRKCQPIHPGARGVAGVGAPWHGGLQMHHLRQGGEPRGPGTRSSPYRARAVAALGVPPGRADPGSNGTRRTRPGGDAKGRVVTRPSGTIPPNTMAGGSA